MARQGCSLLLRNLRFETSPDRVRQIFEKYGRVRDVYLPLDHYTKRPRGFGFVEFYDEKDAKEALREMDKAMLDGNEISVIIAQDRRKSPETMRRYLEQGRGGGRAPDRDMRNPRMYGGGGERGGGGPPPRGMGGGGGSAYNYYGGRGGGGNMIRNNSRYYEEPADGYYYYEGGGGGGGGGSPGHSRRGGNGGGGYYSPGMRAYCGSGSGGGGSWSGNARGGGGGGGPPPDDYYGRCSRSRSPYLRGGGGGSSSGGGGPGPGYLEDIPPGAPGGIGGGGGPMHHFYRGGGGGGGGGGSQQPTGGRRGGRSPSPRDYHEMRYRKGGGDGYDRRASAAAGDTVKGDLWSETGDEIPAGARGGAGSRSSHSSAAQKREQPQRLQERKSRQMSRNVPAKAWECVRKSAPADLSPPTSSWRRPRDRCCQRNGGLMLGNTVCAAWVQSKTSFLGSAFV